MLIAVGSTNPVKVDAVRAAFTALWPDGDWVIESCGVPSGVSDQPMSDDETRQGARSRAVQAIALREADYGIGLEGGLQQADGRWFSSGWVVAVNKDGLEGVASTIKMTVPPRLMEIIEAGAELGQACDRVFNARNTKQSAGFFGIMSKGVIARADAFADAVVAALAVFLHPELMGAQHPVPASLA
jgi:inosine/xanthosine triphosphatase